MRAPEHGVAARTYAYAPRILQANGMIPKTMRRPLVRDPNSPALHFGLL